MEHFIINDGNGIEEEDFKYSYRGITRYRDSVFNFIFIEESLNNKVLGNHAFWKKIELINSDQIECAYSKMIIEKVKQNFVEYPKSNDSTMYDGYFSHVFQTEYNSYVSNVVKELADRLSESDK